MLIVILQVKVEESSMVKVCFDELEHARYKMSLINFIKNLRTACEKFSIITST